MGAPKYTETPNQKTNDKPSLSQLPPKEQIAVYCEIIAKLLEDPQLTKKAAQIISEMLQKKS